MKKGIIFLLIVIVAAIGGYLYFSKGTIKGTDVDVTKEKEKLLNYYLQSIEDCAKIIMVIGPEGGISDKEEDILVSNGYNRVSFGNLIFRVETATIYVASIINYISSRS